MLDEIIERTDAWGYIEAVASGTVYDPKITQGEMCLELLNRRHGKAPAVSIQTSAGVNDLESTRGLVESLPREELPTLLRLVQKVEEKRLLPEETPVLSP